MVQSQSTLTGHAV